MVMSSINCYLESNELISIIIEGKLNYEHYHIGTYGRVLACGHLEGRRGFGWMGFVYGKRL